MFHKHRAPSPATELALRSTWLGPQSSRTPNMSRSHSWEVPVRGSHGTVEPLEQKQKGHMGKSMAWLQGDFNWSVEFMICACSINQFDIGDWSQERLHGRWDQDCTFARPGSHQFLHLPAATMISNDLLGTSWFILVQHKSNHRFGSWTSRIYPTHMPVFWWPERCWSDEEKKPLIQLGRYWNRLFFWGGNSAIHWQSYHRMKNSMEIWMNTYLADDLYTLLDGLEICDLKRYQLAVKRWENYAYPPEIKHDTPYAPCMVYLPT